VPCHVGTLAPPDEYDWTWASFGPPKSTTQMPNRSVQLFLHSSRQKVPTFYNGRPFPQNCPLSRGIRTPSNSWFFGPVRAHSPNGIMIGSSVFTQVIVECPILYNGPRLPPPSKLPLPMGGSGLQSNTWFHGPTRVVNPNGTSIGSAVFAGLTRVTDGPTDRPRYSVGNNRPHLPT